MTASQSVREKKRSKVQITDYVCQWLEENEKRKSNDIDTANKKKSIIINYNGAAKCVHFVCHQSLQTQR